MPYLLLILGVLIGLYAFSRYFLAASPEEMKILVRNSTIAVIGLCILFLAVTGKLVAALGGLFILAPMAFRALQKINALHPQNSSQGSPQPASSNISINEALEILGLDKGASEDEIQTAYKKLMQKVHPDNEGSDWMAARVNQARDRLLKP